MKKKLLLNLFIFIIVSSVFSLDIYTDIIQPGQTLVGSSYKNGGTSPSGFDCSGFITYLYKKYVPGLPRISRNMAGFGESVKRGSILPGDLIFFATGSSSGITHVAIYIGQNSIIHAISNGPNRGVTITSLSARYWQSRYHSAARVVPNSIPSASGSATACPNAPQSRPFPIAAWPLAAPARGGPARTPPSAPQAASWSPQASPLRPRAFAWRPPSRQSPTRAFAGCGPS